VTVAADGEEALRRYEAADGNVDLVITDISMPNLSGPGLAARLREVSPDLDIVVTSGHVDPSEFAELANLGIRDVLRKPFNVTDVVRTVGSALAGREQEGGDHD
jgi:DNA-binding NarL/FixJ family response regulator